MKTALVIHRFSLFGWALALAGGAVGCGAEARTRVGSAELTAGADVRPAPKACRPIASTNRLAVAILGSGGAKSGGRASSSAVVIIDGAPRILVDAGTGAAARLAETNLDTSKLDTVLLTHMHGDHVGDFGDAVRLIASRRTGPEPTHFRVLGPTGDSRYPGTRVLVERVIGREGGPTHLDTGTALVGANAKAGASSDTMVQVDAADIDRADHSKLVLTDAAFTVRTITVDHDDIPSLAYRVDVQGKSIVFSGDLAERTDAMIELAHNADLLVHDAAILDGPPPTPAARALHAPPRRIGQVATQAPVGELLLTHMPNDVRLRQREVIDSIRTSFGGDVEVAEDCMVVVVAK